jgi:hypothetical protein
MEACLEAISLVTSSIATYIKIYLLFLSFEYRTFYRQTVQRDWLSELSSGFNSCLSSVGYASSALVVRFCRKVSEPIAEWIDGSRRQCREVFPHSIRLAQLGGFQSARCSWSFGSYEWVSHSPPVAVALPTAAYPPPVRVRRCAGARQPSACPIWARTPGPLDSYPGFHTNYP